MNDALEVQPKKVLGQYFLKNTSAIMQSIQALRLAAGDTVIEIGPGTAALTGPLSSQCAKIGCDLLAVEKDEALAAAIQLPRTTVITGDILVELPKLAARLKEYKIIGNIPYYITGHLLRVISELENKPSMTVLMVQKEVAQRVCADPPEMNLLAAATQIWAKPKLLLILKPKDFDPSPAVDSAVIELKTLPSRPKMTDLNRYYTAIHRIFKQPRKMLINNLIASAPTGEPSPLDRQKSEEILKKLSLPLTARPQDLTVAHCIAISEQL